MLSAVANAVNRASNLTKCLISAPYIPMRNLMDITVCPNLVRGIDHLRDSRLNKGLAFPMNERQALGLHGLLPPRVTSKEFQLEIVTLVIDSLESNEQKYLYLSELQDTYEKLFFSLLDTDIEKYLPIVYTPTVGQVCESYGLVYRRPRGIFISIYDKGHIFQILRNWPEPEVKAIVCTDGERILGLGDLGAYGMGIPVGKLSLYTALAGMDPHCCLPVMLDVGTDNEELLSDPLYIGLRMRRVRGEKYYEFIDEFMQACKKRYGAHVLIQFEDFALPNARPLLDRYRYDFCTFNDDIQGTASVAVAGLYAAARITKKKLSENVYLFLGAGSAANGIADLAVLAMIDEGLTEKDARARIYMFDKDGLLSTKRSGGIPPHAQKYGKDIEHETKFVDCVAKLKPNCIIGCSTIGGAFTADVLKQMGKNADRPIIFALSNPTNSAECTAQQAYENTEGRCVFASGSPFPPVNYNGKVYTPGQGNNAYIFPGVALGVKACAAFQISGIMFLVAAKTLANHVSQENLDKGLIYPPLKDVKTISLKIAEEVVKIAFAKDIATLHPPPKDIAQFLKGHVYDLRYDNRMPALYKYPDLPDFKLRALKEVYHDLKDLKSQRPKTKQG